MKWGLIARADDRGLANLTWELARNVRPDRILLVDMFDTRFSTHHDRYKGLADMVFTWKCETYNDANPIEESPNVPHMFFADLDLVFTAETFYGLEPAAGVHGAKTVLYAMPEFFHPEYPQATETWLPTSWLADRVPHDRVMEWPCPTDRWFKNQTPYRGHGDTLRVVMPAGFSASQDRNGAKIFLRALRLVLEPVDVTIWTQDRAFPVEPRMSRAVTYRLMRSADHYWQLCTGAHLAVLPRRYGGLCLPAIEAMGAGCALLMTDAAPNGLWPIEPLPCKPGLAQESSLGDIPTWDVEPRDIAIWLDLFASNPELTRDRQQDSREWAHEHSWSNARDRWRNALEEVAER